MPKAKVTTKAVASKAKKAAPAPKKTIAKKTAAPKKAPAVKKVAPAQKAAPAKVAKKEPVAPKKTAKSRTQEKSLDLCLILDCTASMGSWIERSKDTLKQIIDSVKNDNAGLTVRVAFVAYRDITDAQRFGIFPFTDNIDTIKSAIQRQSATGGGDFPEDVQGGFNKALALDWSPDSTKLAFHIADAPGHGKDLVDGGGFGDSYPNGSPDGYKL